MSFTRLLTNLCSDRLGESRDFPVSLLGFEANDDGDSYGHQEPRNAFCGQRRFLTLDPNGCLIDIGSPC